MAEVSPENLYCSFMEEIKFRLAEIKSAIDTEDMFKRKDLMDEYICLQFRKILELIAYSSIAANKEKYSEVHENFAQHWKAKNILDELEKINPDFYPRPAKLSRAGENSFHVTRGISSENGKDQPLTKDEFEQLYNICGRVLHVRKPFADSSNKIDIIYSFSDWIKKTLLLLESHMICLIDNGGFWLVRLSEGIEGKVHTYGISPALGEEYIDSESLKLKKA